MTAIANLPDLRPSLLLDFANSGRVDPRIQCTRASSATCFGPDGKLRTVAANVPRIDYDPATGKCLGLLVEEARTNLFTYSADVTNSVWRNTNLSADGSKVSVAGMDFYKISEVATSEAVGRNIRRFFLSAHTAGTAISIKWFVLEGSRRFCNVLIAGGGIAVTSIALDTKTGEFSVRSSALQGWAWAVKKHVTGVIEITASNASIEAGYTSGAYIDIRPSRAESISGVGSIGESYIGDPNQYLYIGSVQFELGSFPTSYIPTEAAAVTRAADAVSIALTLSGGGGALVMSGSVGASSPNSFIFPVRARGVGLSQAYIGVPYVTTKGTVVGKQGYLRNTSSSRSVLVPGSAIPFSEIFKAAISWDASTMRVGINGASGSGSHSQEAPDCTHVDLMTATHGGAVLGAGHVARVATYNVLLTTTQLERLTA